MSSTKVLLDVMVTGGRTGEHHRTRTRGPVLVKFHMAKASEGGTCWQPWLKYPASPTPALPEFAGHSC